VRKLGSSEVSLGRPTQVKTFPTVTARTAADLGNILFIDNVVLEILDQVSSHP